METPNPQPTYLNAWVAVNKLMREGNGWSGGERNCCFLNVGQKKMANVSAVTRLDLPDDGRALAVTDWDGDGRLDVFLSARTGPRLRLLRNNVDADSHFLSVRLTGVNCNRDAVGARLKLHLSNQADRQLIRTLRAGEGFLGQSSKWVHFGLGGDTQIDRIEIHWPDDSLQTVVGLKADQRYAIRQGQPAVPVTAAPTVARLRDEPVQVSDQQSPERARIVLSAPLTLPELDYFDHTGKRTVLPAKSGSFTLVNLWASWCTPCLRELENLNAHVADLQSAGLDVLALNVDALQQDSNAELSLGAVTNLQQAFLIRYGAATESIVRTLDIVQRGLLDQQRPLALPTSFLLDEQQRLNIIYKGPVTTERLLSDLGEIRRDPRSLAQMSVPFPGRWHNEMPGPDPMLIAMRMIEIGDSRAASEYLQKVREVSANRSGESVSTNLFLARLLAEQHETSQAIATFNHVLNLDPSQVPAMVGLSHALLQQNRPAEAAVHLTRALELDAQQTEAMAYLALARLQQGRTADAVDWYRRALKVRPGWVEVANNLAWILATDRDAKVRNGAEAVRLARQICEATNYQIPGMLDTLAAAYAEAGQFAEALETIDRAAELASMSGQTSVLEKLYRRRQQYETQQPFRAPDSK